MSQWQDGYDAGLNIGRSERDDLRARLSALTDAIGTAAELSVVAAWAGQRVPSHGDYLRGIAAAVQPPDPKEPNDG